MMIDNTIFGDAHLDERCEPFVIGQIEPNKGYVHVFDDVTLDVILGMLDTVSDFVRYLEKKEHFLLNSKMSIYVAGEEELLAYYFRNLDKGGEHDFLSPKENLALP